MSNYQGAYKQGQSDAQKGITQNTSNMPNGLRTAYQRGQAAGKKNG